MKKNFVFIFIILTTVNIFAKNFKLSTVEDNAIATAETENGVTISVIGRYISDENLVRYVVNIQNKGDSDFVFSENMISVEQGNYETSSWVPANHYTATQYYEKKRIEYEVAQTAAKVGLGLAVMDAMFNTYDCRYYRHNYYRPHRPGYNPGYYDSHHRHYYRDPVASMIGSLIGLGIASAAVSSLLYDKNYLPSHLKETLLFDKTVGPGQSYSGYFMASADTSPDYRISINCGQEPLLFVFKRNDRSEIINPWSDPVTERNLIYAGPSFSGYGIGFNMGYALCTSTLGFYSDVLFESNGSLSQTVGKLRSDGKVDFNSESSFNDYFNSSWAYFTPNGDCSRYITDLTLGFTVKTVPHTWLMLGCGIGFGNTNLYGTLEKDGIVADAWVFSDNTRIYFEPQLGFTMVYGFLNFGGKFSWRLGDGENSGPLGSAFIGLTF